MADLFDFERGMIVGDRLAPAKVTKTATMGELGVDCNVGIFETRKNILKAQQRSKVIAE